MAPVFNALVCIMKKHVSDLAIVTEDAEQFYVNTHKQEAKNKAIFFGMVKKAKEKVAYHLMPVYCNPELLSDISPELKKKMQGKSCFNFKQQDDTLFAELDQLTAQSLADYRRAGKV